MRTLRSLVTPATLKEQACGWRCVSGGRPHTVFCGAIGIVGAEGPEPESTEVERNSNGRSDHRQVELRTDHERTDDRGKEDQALGRRARVPVAEARNNRQPRGPTGAQPLVLFEPLRSVDNVALDGLDLKLRAAVGTERRLGRHRTFAPWTPLHGNQPTSSLRVSGFPACRIYPPCRPPNRHRFQSRSGSTMGSLASAWIDHR